MALRSTPSPSSVIGLRRYLQIHPLRAVFFHRAHFSTSLKNFGSTSIDRNGSVPRISHVCPSADHSCTEEMNPSSSRIFVKGLSRSTSEGFLLKQFSQFGEISKVKIVTSRGSKESLGMAYIWFACTESADLAVKEMNGKFFDGRFIAVEMSRPEAPTKHVKFMPYREVTERKINKFVVEVIEGERRVVLCNSNAFDWIERLSSIGMNKGIPMKGPGRFITQRQVKLEDGRIKLGHKSAAYPKRWTN